MYDSGSLDGLSVEIIVVDMNHQYSHGNFNRLILVTNGRALQYSAFKISRLQSNITPNMENLKTYINSFYVSLFYVGGVLQYQLW
jgi:hypothetical protein